MIRIANFLNSSVRAARQRLQYLLESHQQQPLETRDVSLEYARDGLRVEKHMVLNIFTGAVESRVHITLARPQEYTIQVIPLLPDGRVVLAVRFRLATSRWSLELPRLDEQDHDDGWREAAQRCLCENTGLETERWALAGSVYLDPHRSPTSILAVRADNCQPLRERALRPEREIAGTIAVGREALDEMIRDGDIDCGLTLAGLSLLRASGWGA